MHSAKVSIWDEWATAEQTARFGRKAGDLGPVYGHQWRNFGATPRADGTWASDGVDQLKRLLIDLREKPFSRRHLVTGWNPKEADQVALPPCHTLFQFYVTPGSPETRGAERSASSNASGGLGGEAPQHELSCHLYQRSGDVFLGVPFNIASYALFTMMIAQVSGMRAREFVHSFGDAHLYKNHFEQATLQLSREPRALPAMRINSDVKDLFAFAFEDFMLEGYDPHPAISAPVAV